MAGPSAPDGLPAPDDAGDAVAPPPKKGGRLLLVLPLVAAVLGAALGATQRERLAPVLPGVAGTDSAAVAEPSAPAQVEYGEFHEVQGIIINPAGSDGRRFLMVNVAFESSDAKTLEELQAKEVVVRDAIVALLGRHTAEELGRSAMREALKDSLRAHVSAVLGAAGQVERLYFTQYVLQ